jgi:predicted NBD/HSP70 family sugar kinase
LYGCLEAYANSAALMRYAGEGYAGCEQVIAAARAQDPRALEAVREFARHLAAGCAILVNLLDPEALILAGGLAQDNPELLSALAAELPRRVLVWSERRLGIGVSTLGYHAGVLGAAAVALDALA